MRVIDCTCGATVMAANDDELREQVREHLATVHDDTGKSDEDLDAFVAANAYDATDA